MLSDRHRRLKVLSLIAIIFLICLYSHCLGQAEITAGDYVLNPEEYDNTSLFIKTGGIVLETGDGYLDILIDGEEFRVHDEIPGIREGESITGEFIFHREGELEIVRIHVHKYRDVKIAISLIAAVFVLLLLWKTYSFNSSKMVLEEK